MADPLADISLQSSLVKDGQTLAQELDISWGQLISMALKEFIRRHRRPVNLVEQLNLAYAEDSQEESELIMQMRPTHRRLIDGEW